MSYSIEKDQNKYIIDLYGNITLPPGGLVIKNFPVDDIPSSVTVNGNSIKDFNKNNIRVKQFPATVVVTY